MLLKKNQFQFPDCSLWFGKTLRFQSFFGNCAIRIRRKMNAGSPWNENNNFTRTIMQSIVEDTPYEVIQSNGQRIYSVKTAFDIPFPPPKGTEVFVGNLPHDLFEDEIIPLFTKKGPVYNVRMMLDFLGRNRGYAFVKYFDQEDAHAAVQAFNGYRIRMRTRIAVSISVDNRRLFIGNIPKDRSLEEIKYILMKYVEGIVDVILYQEPYNYKLNRGFVFVEFESHRLAAIARRHLSPGNLVVWGQPVFVDWAEPLPIVNPDVLKHIEEANAQDSVKICNRRFVSKFSESPNFHRSRSDVQSGKFVLKGMKAGKFGLLYLEVRYKEVYYNLYNYPLF